MVQDLGDEMIRRILESCRVLAVVGMSRDAGKAAGRVPRYLAARGFTVIPVNPNAETIEGRQGYSRLSEVKENIDAVVIFRPSGEVLPVVGEAVARKKQRGDLRVVWMQEGIRDETAARLAEGQGLIVVQDRCMAKEYRRLYEGS
ncbi:MAG: CoA-binding protein [Deltaproteobacteria bacterium]|nr:CoA-binding protein [Deltaproteobacteria bacterium]